MIRPVLLATVALLVPCRTFAKPIVNGEVPAPSTNDNGPQAPQFGFAVSLQGPSLDRLSEDDAADQPEHFCGGTYLGGGWIVTANHCVVGFKNKTIYAYIGGQPLNGTGGTELLEVTERISHPDYNRITLAADIALLRVDTETPSSEEQTDDYDLLALLEESSELSDSILLPTRPINGNGGNVLNLVQEEDDEDGGDEDLPAGEECHIFGYGAASYYGPISEALRFGPVQPLEYDRCVEMLGPVVAPVAPNSGMFCAIGYADACRGDSGGGLVCRRRVTLEEELGGVAGKLTRPYTLRGIISYGAGCGGPALPGVYTDVGFFRAWIDRWTNAA